MDSKETEKRSEDDGDSGMTTQGEESKYMINMEAVEECRKTTTAFTDGDLRRLKDGYGIDTPKLLALLARLGAAEAVIHALPRLEAGEINADEYFALVAAWRKSKGRE